MSRRKLKARDKVIQKMSRDGVVEINAVTGGEESISKREADFDIRGDKPKRETSDAWASSSAKAERPALSQVGTRLDGKPNSNKKTSRRYNEALQKTTNPQRQNETTSRQADTVKYDTPTVTEQKNTEPPHNTPDTLRHQSAVSSVNPREPPNQTDGTGKLKTRSSTVYQEQPPTAIRHKQDSEVSPLKHQSEKLTFSENKEERPAVPKQNSGKHTNKRKNSKYKQKQSSAIRHEPQKADSTLAHRKEATPSAAATVIQADSEGKFKTQRETVLRHNKAELKTDSFPLVLEMIETAQTEGEHIGDTADTLRDVPRSKPDVPPDTSPNPFIQQGKRGKYKQNRDTVYQHNKPVVLQNEPQKPDSPLSHKPETVQTENADTRQTTDTTQTAAKTTDNSAVQPQSTERDAPFDNEAAAEQSAADDTQTDKKPIKDANLNSSIKHDKSGKLKFSEDETTPEKSDKKSNRKLEKAERQAEQTGKKLEKAKNKLPTKRKLRTERVFDEKKGTAKRKLYFEKEVKTQGQHLKGALPLRPVKAGSNALMLKAHSKIYQVEHENVAIKAAHRVEMIGEAGVRFALRHHKTAPYRKVAKLEKRVAKKTIRLNYQKALANNPKLKSNMLSRMWQKRKIKKDYAKAAREAKKTAARVKKAGSYTVRATKAIAQAIYKNPKVLAIIILLFLLIVIFMSLFSMAANIGNGGLTAILSSSYLAEDEDIEQAELSYSEWETDLQFQVFNTESSNPGYDEYRYDIGDISHNPYELMAYLTAVYQNFSYADISADLQALFNEQYTLTLTPTTETRYADPTDANGDGDYEPYEWNVLTVKLTARSFSEVILSKMTAEQQIHYTLLMQTKGNRQYAGNPFDVGWLPYVTSYYGYRVHPITGAKDLHRGVDIALPAGMEIRSTQDGTVTFAGHSGGYGNVVVIENANGVTTKYAHCDTISVSVGQTVSIGDVIATVGNTGDSTGAHLHYELLKDGEYLNPLYYTDTGNFSLSPIYGTPGMPMGDGSYTALIAEAESHLGKPYVFGSNGPNSFDCSSYICYILTQSGVKNMPRTTAQGIYNQCTPIPESERQPGDLVFFHSTYSTSNTVTHVALYVGNGWIIHAGSPIQYTQIDGNSYWQAHLYSYGRLN